ncbi:hypothetical protein COCON_G00181350 [Conger conger]|uniref:Uncharacterized protein n=1 Tax=Conger conger TaxID=82655 RepID=A0A9Q1HT03_CONCO|nr:hypothetical protein COCON_G00181350 [Conger conger]
MTRTPPERTTDRYSWQGKGEWRMSGSGSGQGGERHLRLRSCVPVRGSEGNVHLEEDWGHLFLWPHLRSGLVRGAECPVAHLKQ